MFFRTRIVDKINWTVVGLCTNIVGLFLKMQVVITKTSIFPPRKSGNNLMALPGNLLTESVLAENGSHVFRE